MGNKSPVHAGQYALAVDLTDHRDLRARRDIEAVGEAVLMRADIEVTFYRCLTSADKTAAHIK
jgi:hypothetical protein